MHGRPAAFEEAGRGMAVSARSGRGRLIAYAAGESWRAMSYRLHGSPIWRFRYSGRVPERLLIAPTDLRTADPTVAMDIYAGRFRFAGEAVAAGAESVFALEPPSREWSRRLHGFAWLRHLRASDMAVSRPNARALVGDRLSDRQD